MFYEILVTWIAFLFGVISVTDAHISHTAKTKTACCSFRAEVDLRKARRSPIRRKEQKSYMKTMDCSYLYKG